ncbi:MAG: S8 family serine peptidase [Clostridia bacterium]|nr:S8 family serine peptidase [Clostridia bacterium]
MSGQENNTVKKIAIATVVLALVAALAAAAFWFFVKYKNQDRSDGSPEQDVSGQGTSAGGETAGADDARTVKLDESDVIYIPSAETLEYSGSDYLIYYRDLIEVFTIGEVSPSRQNKLAALVNGKVVGKTSGAINTLQIKTTAAGLDEIKNKSEILMREKDVLYAGCEMPVRLDETTADPWSAEPSSPQNKSWWVEAIGAENAWKIADSDAYRSVPMKTIGIIDEGVDESHEELSGKVSRPAEFESSSPANHGTAVAGFAAAKGNNGAGIRGVSDRSGLQCIDLKVNDLFTDILNTSSGFIAAYNKLVNSGANVINLSQAYWMCDETYFKKNKSAVLEGESEDIKKSIKTYDEYVRYRNNDSFEWGLKCICIAASLLVNKHTHPDEDFLLVQAAGNGYNNEMQVGSDVKYSGMFCAIDESIWSRLPAETRNALAESEYNITYEAIDDRIIIVGGIKNEKAGINYKMSECCFGEAVDICAPADDLFDLNTVSDGSYSTKNDRGTSLAAPLVSGAAALIWSLAPELSAPEVKNTLLQTAVSTAVYKSDPYSPYNKPVLNVGEAAKKVTGLDFERYGAYADALRTIINDHRLPDGTEVKEEYMDDNTFAVCDIDSDNRDELIYRIENTFMGGRVSHIYDYDNERKTLVLEAEVNPYTYFFTNGILREDTSHNQTHSTFWPYSVSKYDPDSDMYIETDNYYLAIDKDMGSDFDETADLDGDGRIFTVSGGRSFIDNKDYEDSVAALMGTEYEYFPVPYRRMTAENIEDLAKNGPQHDIDRSMSRGSGTVTGTGLRVRKGPGTEYDICCEIKKGTKFEVYDFCSGNKTLEGYGWTLIEYEENKFGWVNDAYVDYTLE